MTITQQNRRRDLALASVAFIIALALWQMQGLFFITQPLRLFVTMIHELGHGMSAVLSGGEFLRFEVTKRGAGVAYTRGGYRPLIIQAGYLGTAVFGGALLLLTHRTDRPGRVAMGVGAFIAILTLAYSGININHLTVFETLIVLAILGGGAFLILTRETDEGRYAGVSVAALSGFVLVIFAGSGNELTIAVGILSGLALILLGWRANRDVVVIVLTFLAFLTGLQAITDSWILFKIVQMPASMVPFNDAASMSKEAFGPAWLWALVWILMDIVIFGAAVWYALIKPARR